MTEMQQQGGTARELHDTEMKRLAESSFAKHTIVSREPGRFRLAQVDGRGSFGGIDVLVGFGGHLYVGGDTSVVAFAYGPTAPRSRIAWIGGTTDVSYYVLQKARIGLGYSPQTFDHGVARFELAELVNEIGDAIEDDGESHGFSSLAEMGPLVSVLESFHSGVDAATLHEELADLLVDGWEYGDIGMVPAPRVYFAWAAVRRLHLILFAEEEERNRRFLAGLERLSPAVHQALATAVHQAASGRHVRVPVEDWHQAHQLRSLALELLRREHGFGELEGRSTVAARQGSVAFIPSVRGLTRVEHLDLEAADPHPADPTDEVAP